MSAFAIAGILIAICQVSTIGKVIKITERLDAQQKLIEAWQERNEILSDILLMMGKEMSGKELKDLK